MGTVLGVKQLTVALYAKNPCPLSPAPLWEAQLRKTIITPPVIMDNRVFIETTDSVIALECLTGVQIWHSKIDFNTTSAARIVAGDGVVVVAPHAGVIALDAATGTRLWQDEILGQFPTSLAIYGGQLFAAFAFGQIRVYDLDTGSVLWQSDEAGKAHTIPSLVVSVDHVIVVQGWRIYSLNTSSGQLEWEMELEENLSEPVLSHNEEQVLIYGDTTIYSIGLADGEVLQKISTEGAGLQGNVNPIVVGDQILWVSGSMNLHSADIESGTILWESEVEGDEVGFPLSSGNGFIWVMANSPTLSLTGYELITGQKLVEHYIGVPVMLREVVGPVTVDDVMYLSIGNRVTACSSVLP